MEIKPKFKIGQVLWAMHDNIPTRFIPDKITITHRIESEKNLSFTDTIKLMLFKPKQIIFKEQRTTIEQYHCMKVTSSDTYGGVPFYFRPHELFTTKEELLKSL